MLGAGLGGRADAAGPAAPARRERAPSVRLRLLFFLVSDRNTPVIKLYYCYYYRSPSLSAGYFLRNLENFDANSNSARKESLFRSVQNHIAEGADASVRVFFRGSCRVMHAKKVKRRSYKPGLPTVLEDDGRESEEESTSFISPQLPDLHPNYQ